MLPTVDKSLASNLTSAISPSFKKEPSELAFTIIFLNSSSLTKRPRTWAEYSNCCSLIDGNLPIEPAGVWVFCDLIAVEISVAVTPN